jgi:hypothetical protein
MKIVASGSEGRMNYDYGVKRSKGAWACLGSAQERGA